MKHNWQATKQFQNALIHKEKEKHDCINKENNRKTNKNGRTIYSDKKKSKVKFMFRLRCALAFEVGAQAPHGTHFECLGRPSSDTLHHVDCGTNICKETNRKKQ